MIVSHHAQIVELMGRLYHYWGFIPWPF